MAMPYHKNLCLGIHKIEVDYSLVIITTGILRYSFFSSSMPRSRGDEFKINTSIFTLFTLKVSPLVPGIFVVVLRSVKIKTFFLPWIFKYQYSLKLFSVFFKAKDNCYRGTRFVTQFSGQPSHQSFILTNL